MYDTLRATVDEQVARNAERVLAYCFSPPASAVATVSVDELSWQLGLELGDVQESLGLLLDAEVITASSDVRDVARYEPMDIEVRVPATAPVPHGSEDRCGAAVRSVEESFAESAGHGHGPVRAVQLHEHVRDVTLGAVR